MRSKDRAQRSLAGPGVDKTARGCAGHPGRGRRGCSRVGGVVVAHPTQYRVDANLGGSLSTHMMYKDGTDTLWSDSNDFLPTLGPREYYRTEGMNDLMLNMVSEMSYDCATALLNRVRRVEHNLTPERTIAAIVEREGNAVHAQIELIGYLERNREHIPCCCASRSAPRADGGETLGGQLRRPCRRPGACPRKEGG